MFCKNCGKQLPDDSKFCDACGTKVASEPVKQPLEQKATEQQIPTEQQSGTEQQKYTAPQPFQTQSTIDPNQPIYQKTAFSGQQYSVGSSGYVSFGGEKKKKKKGCLIAFLVTFLLLTGIGLALVFLLSNSTVINIKTSTGYDSATATAEGVSSIFQKDTANIYVSFGINKLESGTKISSEWIYINQDKETTHIDTAYVYTGEETNSVYFYMNKPVNGWPSGEYEVKIYVEGEYIKSARFKVSD